MNDSKLQFRVGLFVIVAMTLAGGMAFKFGEISTIWQKHYTVAVHFESAPGVHQNSPVQTNGITIGSVRDVVLDEKRGGISVLIDIREQYRLRKDTQPQLVRSLLGDTTIEFSPGVSTEYLKPGTLLHGEEPVDPMKIVDQLEKKMTTTMESFAATSQEWQKVAANLNGLMDTNSGNLNVVIERTAESLQAFTTTMTLANKALTSTSNLLDDPVYQANFKKTMSALPEMVKETQLAISTIRLAVGTADKNLKNLEAVTSPLAQKSTSIVTKLDNSLGNLELLSEELALFTQMVTKEDGTLQKFASDPELYRNLNLSAASMAVLFKNLEPVMSDLRIFSDKIARHPELLGVRGAVKGSSGLKDPPHDEEVPRSTGNKTKRLR